MPNEYAVASGHLRNPMADYPQEPGTNPADPSSTPAEPARVRALENLTRSTTEAETASTRFLTSRAENSSEVNGRYSFGASIDTESDPNPHPPSGPSHNLHYRAHSQAANPNGSIPTQRLNEFLAQCIHAELGRGSWPAVFMRDPETTTGTRSEFDEDEFLMQYFFAMRFLTNRGAFPLERSESSDSDSDSDSADEVTGIHAHPDFFDENSNPINSPSWLPDLSRLKRILPFLAIPVVLALVISPVMDAFMSSRRAS